MKVKTAEDLGVSVFMAINKNVCLTMEYVVMAHDTNVPIAITRNRKLARLLEIIDCLDDEVFHNFTETKYGGVELEMEDGKFKDVEEAFALIKELTTET